jgi:hypothetical protein
VVSASSGPSVLWINSEPGIGKTTAIQRRTVRVLFASQLFSGAVLAVGITVGALLAQDMLTGGGDRWRPGNPARPDIMGASRRFHCAAEGRECVPQAPVEAIGFEAERTGAEPSDAEPPSSRPGTRPGDHPAGTR